MRRQAGLDDDPEDVFGGELEDSPICVPSIDRATENLVKWSARGEWEPLQREFYAANFEPVVHNFDLPDDDQQLEGRSGPVQFNVGSARFGA